MTETKFLPNQNNLPAKPVLRIAAEQTQPDKIPNQSRLTQILVLTLAVLILACLNKLLLGTGQNFAAGQIILQSNADIYFARISSFAILLLSFTLAAATGISHAALKKIALFWLPFVLYLWIKIPIFRGEGEILLRTLNFLAVIASMSILASNRRNAMLFLDYIYFLMALANLIGLTLYMAKVPFSYFSDGYGLMFTGVFPQKDILSTTAALGACLAIPRILMQRNFIHLAILTLQITTLFFASTLSSLGAFGFGVLAIFAPVFAIGLAGSIALFLPLIHPLFAPITILLGKDPSLTGRTRLWEFTLDDALKSPIFGNGFRHISATADWMQMIQSEFRSDSFFIPHSHNLWVEGFDKFGVVGLLLLAVALIIWPMFLTRPPNGQPFERICFALLPFWLFKSALTVPFLNSDTTAYFWIFCLSFCVAWLEKSPLRQRT